MYRYALIVLAAAGAVSAIRLSATTGTDATVPPPPNAPAVKPAGPAIAAAGLIEAAHENTAIGVPVPALVKSVDVRVWDKVAAGQPLLTLDDTEIQAALVAHRANVDAAKASVRLAEAELARVNASIAKWNAVSDPRAISPDELNLKRGEGEIAAARLDSARAQLKVAQARVTEAEALAARLVVRAPIAGTVLQVNTRAGEFATPGATRAPLVLGDVETLQLRCDIDEQIAPRMRPGLDAIAYLKGDTAKSIDLKFVRIEPFVIPKQSLTGSSSERVDTRVLQVIYRFAKPVDRAVYVGQQMDVYIGEKPAAATTPAK